MTGLIFTSVILLILVNSAKSDTVEQSILKRLSKGSVEVEEANKINK